MPRTEEDVQRAWRLLKEVSSVFAGQRESDAFEVMSYLLGSLIAQSDEDDDKETQLERLKGYYRASAKIIEEFDRARHNELVRTSPPEEVIAITPPKEEMH